RIRWSVLRSSELADVCRVRLLPDPALRVAHLSDRTGRERVVRCERDLLDHFNRARNAVSALPIVRAPEVPEDPGIQLPRGGGLRAGHEKPVREGLSRTRGASAVHEESSRPQRAGADPRGSVELPLDPRLPAGRHLGLRVSRYQRYLVALVVPCD